MAREKQSSYAFGFVITLRTQMLQYCNPIFVDIVDHILPTMLIVGSRGLGQIKGFVLFFRPYNFSIMSIIIASC